MTKPLPILIFKKQSNPNMETLENSLKNFSPNGKIGELFVEDIQFDAYDDPCKRIYNEIYPCVFQPKSNVLPNQDGDFWTTNKFYLRLTHEGILQKEWDGC